MDQPVRFPWDDFPDVLIHAPELFVKRHASYAQAKAGDAIAAARLVMDSLADDVTNRLSLEFGKYSPLLLPVLAEESAGLNPIPRVMAEVLGYLLHWNVETQVLQSNVVGHTGAGGFVRLANQALFSGAVRSGLHYVLVDDFIGQGGTLANVRGHILARGGRVVGACVLTGKAHSAKLAPTSSQLDELGRKHGTTEPWWRQRFGFGFDCLTASEARYLIQTPTSERIIERLDQAGRGG